MENGKVTVKDINLLVESIKEYENEINDIETSIVDLQNKKENLEAQKYKCEGIVKYWNLHKKRMEIDRTNTNIDDLIAIWREAYQLYIDYENGDEQLVGLISSELEEADNDMRLRRIAVAREKLLCNIVEAYETNNMYSKYIFNDTKTTSLMDDFRNSRKDFLELKNFFSFYGGVKISGIYDISLVIAKSLFYECWDLSAIGTGFILTNLKRYSREIISERLIRKCESLNQNYEQGELCDMFKEILENCSEEQELAKGETQVVLFNEFYSLRAQDRVNRYCGKYGETDDYTIVGYILEREI